MTSALSVVGFFLEVENYNIEDTLIVYHYLLLFLLLKISPANNTDWSDLISAVQAGSNTNSMFKLLFTL